jgi:glyoxylate reductase
MKFKVLITRDIPETAEKLLKKNNFEVKVHRSQLPLSFNEFAEIGKDVSAIIPVLSDKIDKKLLSKLPNLKIIANYAVGYNNIDLIEAKKRNIVVTNTPNILTDATADLAMGLAIAASRSFGVGERMVREGKFNGWSPKMLLGPQLKGAVFGIIGAGRIGQATAKRAAAFGAKIIYYSRTRKPEFEDNLVAKKVSLNKLLATSDFISIHVPLTDKTFHMLNAENMNRLKKGVVIVNTARGEIMDENVLIKMLKNGTVFAAGLDVYEKEPKVKKTFLKLENVVLLPHLGTATFETRSAMAKLAAENVINVLKGKAPLTPVE